MAINVLLKRSTTASKRPTAAQLDIGELSLNYDANTAGVFFEDSAGNVRKVGPAEVSATAPNVSPAGSSGNSLGELWYDTSTSTLKIWTGSSFVAVGGGNTYTFSATPPSSPAEGDTWLEADTGIFYVYVVDVNGGQWAELGPNGYGPPSGGSVTVDPVIAGMIF